MNDFFCYTVKTHPPFPKMSTHLLPSSPPTRILVLYLHNGFSFQCHVTRIIFTNVVYNCDRDHNGPILLSQSFVLFCVLLHHDILSFLHLIFGLVFVCIMMVDFILASLTPVVTCSHPSISCCHNALCFEEDTWFCRRRGNPSISWSSHPKRLV